MVTQSSTCAIRKNGTLTFSSRSTVYSAPSLVLTLVFVKLQGELIGGKYVTESQSNKNILPAMIHCMMGLQERMGIALSHGCTGSYWISLEL